MRNNPERPTLVEMLDRVVDMRRELAEHLAPGEIRAMVVTALAAITNHVEGNVVAALIDLTDGHPADEHMELFAIAGLIVPIARTEE